MIPTGHRNLGGPNPWGLGNAGTSWVLGAPWALGGVTQILGKGSPNSWGDILGTHLLGGRSTYFLGKVPQILGEPQALGIE